MALSVKVDHPDLPPGTEITISGLGSFKNGEAREVTPAQQQAFASERGMLVEDAFADNDILSAEGSSEVEVPEPTTVVVSEPEPVQHEPVLDPNEVLEQEEQGEPMVNQSPAITTHTPYPEGGE